MPNFTLTCEHRKPWDESLDTRITVEFDKETLTEVIDQFQDFLRGCGYYFDGHLEIVTDEEAEVDDEAYFWLTDTHDGARAFDNMASSLMNPPEQQTTCSNCPVCKLDAEVMSRHKCFDPKCGLK